MLDPGITVSGSSRVYAPPRMPWRKARDQRCPAGEPWAVIVDDGSDEVVGCHETEADAQRQIDALYANDVAAVAAADGEHRCSCQDRPSIVAEIAAGIAGADVAGDAERLARTTPRAAANTEPFNVPFPVPEYPPAEWFDGPPDWVEEWRRENGYGPSLDENGVLKLTVTDEGRVGGWFYDAGQCIIHDHTACPGPSPTRYAAFHQNDIIVADGTTLRVGVIGNTHGHASPWVDYVQAQRHYADPSAQMIVCRAGDDERGGWIAGAIVPGLTFGDVAMLRRCALSGDWRPMPATWWLAHNVSAQAVAAAEGYDAIGPTLVTRPALPLVTAFTAALSDHPSAILGGNGGVQIAEESPFVEVDDGTVQQFVQEVPTGMRTTRLHQDGTIEIVDSSPEEEHEREQQVSLRASLTGDLDLPLAPVDRAWDPDGAAARVMRYVADGDGRTANAAYLWREPGDDPVTYALPFADVVDGELVAVPAGIAAAAARVDEMPAHARNALRANLDSLYERMSAEHGDTALRAPWTAAPEDEMLMEDDGGDASAPANITVGEWQDTQARLAALEEFCSAMIEAQAAALVAEEPPDPFQAAASALVEAEEPLPDLAALDA